MTFVAWNPELFLGTNMNGLVLRCLGPGFTVLALGPGFRPIIIIITNMNMKNISDYDNQETIAQQLWNIRMTRIILGIEC